MYVIGYAFVIDLHKGRNDSYKGKNGVWTIVNSTSFTKGLKINTKYMYIFHLDVNTMFLDVEYSSQLI